MSFSMQSKGMDEDTQHKLASFLTEFEEDINCRIEVSETLMALMLYRSMGERDRQHLTKKAKDNDVSPSCSTIANKLEGLSWSIRGLSRQEAEGALRRVPGSPRLVSENRGLNSNTEE